MDHTDLEHPQNQLPAGIVKGFLLVLTVVLGILVLSRLKAAQIAGMSQSRSGIPRGFGTTDPVLQRAIATNDVATIKERLAVLPKDRIRPSIVDTLAYRSTAKSLDAFLSAGWEPSGGRHDNGAFLSALARGDTEVVNVFLRHGLSGATTDRNGIPAIAYAIRLTPYGIPDGAKKCEALTKLILDHGGKTEGEWTEMRPQSRFSAESLLRGYPPQGTTFRPLYLASTLHNPVAARVLLERRADPNWAPTGGVPPIIVARDDLHTPELTQLLLEYGARPDATGEINRYLRAGKQETVTATSLYFNAESGDDETVRILLRHGANPNRPASNGKTPYEAARGDALELLRKYRKGR